MTATKPGPELIDPTGTTSGHVLTSTGGSTAPTFQAGGGGWEFVQTISADAQTNIDLGTSNIDSGYDYMIHCRNVDNSADLSWANSPRLQFGTGGTPTYQTATYTNQYVNFRGNAVTAARDPFTSGVQIAAGNNIGGAGAGETWEAEIIISDPATSAEHWCWAHHVSEDDSGLIQTSFCGGKRSVAETITGFRIKPGTGTFITGDFTLYKRANA